MPYSVVRSLPAYCVVIALVATGVTRAVPPNRTHHQAAPSTARINPTPNSALAAKAAAQQAEADRMELGDNPLPHPPVDRVTNPGDNCDDLLKIEVAYDVVVLNDLTTCGRGNDYDTTPLGYYDSGEDLVIEITVLYPGYYGFLLDPQGTVYAGFMLTESCPPGSDFVFVHGNGYSGSPQSEDCIFLETGVYYLMVDTWSPPGCIPSFSLEISPMFCDVSNDFCDYAEPIVSVVDYPFSTDIASFDGPGECMTSRNIWFLYTAPYLDYVTFSLCGSSYDTKLAVYEGSDCATATLLDCNDDACGLQSELTLTVEAGQDYLIEIGGYGTDHGDGVLSVYGSFEDPFTCWPNTASENEPCGDALNDGCNVDPPVFDTIGSNDSICGTAWAQNGTRDTDWYLFELTERSEITAHLFVDFPMVVGIVKFDQMGVVDCDLSLGSMQPYATAAEWDPATISTIRPAGQYIVLVAPFQFDYHPCSSYFLDYGLILETEPAGSTWCETGGGCDEYIARVQLGTIDNSSACAGYSDFTSLSTDLQAGFDYPIIITSDNGYSGDDCAVWVDWDHDHSFYGPDERIPLEVETGYGPFTGTITPPSTALPGPTHLRIRLSYGGTPENMDPCGITAYGEVEDYMINVIEAAETTWLQDPDPFHVFHKYALSPADGSFYLSNAIAPGTDVTAWENIALTVGTCEVPVVGSEVIEAFGDLPGVVRQVTFGEKEFIECYEGTIEGLIFDTVLIPFTLAYDSAGVAGQWSGSALLRGHRSGDLNMDGAVNIGDITLLAGYLFNGVELTESGLADIDTSGDENISDLTWFVAYLFGGGPPPRHN